MANQVGRISGPLLQENLLRNGIDLKFQNTKNDTSVLKLDVNNNRIGVNTDTTIDDLTVSTTFQTKNLLNTVAYTPSYTISDNNIVVNLGDIDLFAQQGVVLSALETDNLNIDDNTFSSLNADSNIELRPNGTGTVEIFNGLEVFGNIATPGNISADGNIILGDGNADTIDFNSEVASDLIPDQNNTYSIGYNNKRWNHTYTSLLNGEVVSAEYFNVPGLVLSPIKEGNTFYVAINGNDTNNGDSPQAPYATLKRALEASDASTDGPVVIMVYPGVYQEELPLTLPPNTTVIGADMRNTIITPDTTSQSEDVFLLDGETCVANITVKDFFYDSLNDKGYAFRFKSGAVISSRSPYVQNVSVITQGTTTSASDPRGFDSGDAGKGVLVDGADVDAASRNASMLFHSVTLITPGVDAVTMTNGVRVEWLNSFTYFANRGLYAVNGVTGHLSTDGSTVEYGAEIRSIGSANVYGNYGAWADGGDTIMYLIQHNFAYIGSGKNSSNDNTTVEQTQETTELNDGRVYYTSTDQLGNFRVGDDFYVNLEDGTSSVVNQATTLDALSQIIVRTGTQETVLRYDKIDTGNFRLRDNTIETLSGTFEVDSANGNINLNSDTKISKNLDITGNFSIGGTLNSLGNSPTDTINFNADVNEDIIPDISNLYSLGSPTRYWDNIFLSEANFDSIKFQDNFITTTHSNEDLELRANGTGTVYFPNNDYYGEQNITVLGQSTFQKTNFDNITQVGDRIVTTDTRIFGNLDVSGVITTGLDGILENVVLRGNVVETTLSNSDLELRASGTGTVNISQDNVVFANNAFANSIVVPGIELTESAVVNLTAVETLSVNSSPTNFEEIIFSGNYISTTSSNADLELRASGTGEILLPNNDAQINQNLDVGSINSVNINIGNKLSAEKFIASSNIEIFDNVITTTESNSNLELDAQGTSYVQLENFRIVDDTINTATSDIVFGVNTVDLVSNKAIKIPVGNTAQELANQGDIRFNTQSGLFEGYNANRIIFGGVYSSDRLTNLTAHKTANTLDMQVAGNDVATVNGGGIELHGMQVDDISFQNNLITTTVSNSDLDLERNGLGKIVIGNTEFVDNTIYNQDSAGALILSNTDDGYVKFDGNVGFVLPKGTEAERPGTPVAGDTRWNTDSTAWEVYNGTEWISADGSGASQAQSDMEDLTNEWTLILG